MLKRPLAIVLSASCFLTTAFADITIQAPVESCHPGELESAASFPNRIPTSDAYQALYLRRQQAEATLQNWERAERSRLLVLALDGAGLISLPIDSASPLRRPPGYEQEFSPHQYSRLGLAFEIRRAALFAKLMEPNSEPLTAGDLSDANGDTPTGRHRPGAHQLGEHADLYYVPRAGLLSARTLADIDLDATMWVIYSLLESRGTAMILTAHRDAFVARAQEWFDNGLIGWEALLRFQSTLQENDAENHDQHMHVNATDPKGSLFEGSWNDVYRCESLQRVCTRHSYSRTATWDLVTGIRAGHECRHP